MIQSIRPRHAFDTFCTCPKCQCLGHHTVEQKVWDANYVRGVGDCLIDVRGFADPPDGTPVTWRTCSFCEHRWWLIHHEEGT